MKKKTLSAHKNNRIIVILGPTSSGKSDVAIWLAKKFDGEIISADSRQIYRGMDVGTGKVEPDQSGEIPQKFMNNKFCAGSLRKKLFISEGIAHYGIDIVNPKTEFNVTKFKKYADKKIYDILKRKKVPIICGGTGFWIKAIIDNVTYPEVAPNWKLRNRLQKYPKEKLFAMLQKLDSIRAKNIDKNNPVRLIRAIEICKILGKVPTPPKSSSFKEEVSRRDEGIKFLQIGISITKEKLHQNIKKRLRQRFESGMVEEVKKLHFKDKISWKRLGSFGLGYKLIPQYLRKEIANEDELFEKIFQAEKDYAKRQMTWFSRDKRIVWLPVCRRDRKKYKNIEKEVKKFIN